MDSPQSVGVEWEALVARKLRDYEERTRPLVEHYRQRGAELISVPVTATTRPQHVAELLERRPRAHRCA